MLFILLSWEPFQIDKYIVFEVIKMKNVNRAGAQPGEASALVGIIVRIN